MALADEAAEQAREEVRRGDVPTPANLLYPTVNVAVYAVMMGHTTPMAEADEVPTPAGAELAR